MRPKRTDANHAAIVAALRRIGASVQSLHMVGDGCPDLLVGYHGVNVLLEVKDGAKPASRQRLTDDQRAWMAAWQGSHAIVTDIEGAIRAVVSIAKTARQVDNAQANG